MAHILVVPIVSGNVAPHPLFFSLVAIVTHTERVTDRRGRTSGCPAADHAGRMQRTADRTAVIHDRIPQQVVLYGHCVPRPRQAIGTSEFTRSQTCRAHSIGICDPRRARPWCAGIPNDITCAFCDSLMLALHASAPHNSEEHSGPTAAVVRSPALTRFATRGRWPEWPPSDLPRAAAKCWSSHSTPPPRFDGLQKVHRFLQRPC